MSKYEIYKITNKITNKNYIGYTSKGSHNRFHKHYINALYGINTYLYKAIRKYGIENFNLTVIDNSNCFNEIRNKEISWIDYYDSYKNGYNMTRGGDGGNIIDQLSPEKYNSFINKKIEQTTAEKNPRYSGYTDQEIVDYAIKCYIENDFNWIQSKWFEDYCDKLNLPKSFSKCRFNNKGFKELKEQMVLKLNEQGYNITDIKYKITKKHKESLSNININKKWYHNDILKINKQLIEPIDSNWKLGRKKFK